MRKNKFVGCLIIFIILLMLIPLIKSEVIIETGDDTISVIYFNATQTDTNATTECGDNEYLRGDGTCQVIVGGDGEISNTSISTLLNSTYLTTYNASYAGLIQNDTYLSVYNATIWNIISGNNDSWFTTYNATYDAISTASELSNNSFSTISNATYLLIGMNDSFLSTYNITYHGLIENASYLSVYNATLWNIISGNNDSWFSTYNATYAAISGGGQISNDSLSTLLNATYLTTYNASYAGLIQNDTYLSSYNATYWGAINNASYLSTYNVTYHGLINNASYLSTYNATYAAISSASELSNNSFSTISNATYLLTEMNDSFLSTYNSTIWSIITGNNDSWFSTYNATYAAISSGGQISNDTLSTLLNSTYLLVGNNDSFLSTYNVTYHGLIQNASYLSTYNATYWGSVNNASYLSTYNATYAAISSASELSNNSFSTISNATYLLTGMNDSFLSTYNATLWSIITGNNDSWFSTYNATYAAMSAGGEISNDTLSTLLNSTYLLVGNNDSFLSTYNASYAGLIQNDTYLSSYNATYWGAINNVSYLSTYNKTIIDIITGNNDSWFSTYNATYAAISSASELSNNSFSTISNATYLLTGMNDSFLSTYNATYWGSVNNASYLSTYNATYDANTLSNIFDQTLNTTSTVTFNQVNTSLLNVTRTSFTRNLARIYGEWGGAVGGNINLLNISGNIQEDAGTLYGIFLNPVTGGGTPTSKVYGIYVDVSGAPNNYPAIFQGGNVGIGNTTPTESLQVSNGNLIVTNASSTGTYLGLFKSGGLPGYEGNAHPVLKTDYQFLYLSLGGGYTGYIGNSSGNGVFALRDVGGNIDVLLSTNGVSQFKGGNINSSYNNLTDVDCIKFRSGGQWCSA